MEVERKYMLDKETANTVRYKEIVPMGEIPVSKYIYIYKWALKGQEPPKEITVKFSF